MYIGRYKDELIVERVDGSLEEATRDGQSARDPQREVSAVICSAATPPVKPIS